MSDQVDLEDVLMRYGEFEDDMEMLAADRQRMLEALGMSEHEWACAGGEKFPPFEKPSDKFAQGVPAESPPPALLIPPLPPELQESIPPLPPELQLLPAAPPPPVIWLGPPLPPARPKPKIEWTIEQLGALGEIDVWFHDSKEPFFSLTGPAGTGKSTLVREIVDRYAGALDDLYFDSDRETHSLAAMTGKAALRLSQCAGRDASTLHKILYWPPQPGEETKFTRVRDIPSKFVITDESSMMTPTVFKDLHEWAQRGVRVLLVGDDYQLPPVITGEELKTFGEDYSVFSHVRGTRLSTVMRSVGGVLRAATRVRETGEICRESDFENGEGYEYIESRNSTASAVDLYLEDRDDHMVITWRNKTRMQANHAIRERLGHDGPLPDEGEPVLIKRNGQGFLNGEIVECGSFDTGPIVGSIQTMWMTTKFGQRVLVTVNGGREGEFFDGGNPWIENWKKYHIDLNKQCLPEPTPVTWGYVLTAHSAQGSEARRVTVFLTRGDERNEHFRKLTTLPSGERVTMAARWLYTATTRSKHQTTMIVGR